MKHILWAILLCSWSLAFAQQVLHVSTIPSKSDIYVGTTRPDHANMPDHRSPEFIAINEDQKLQGEILLHIFHEGFSDTTLRVKLPAADTSYLVVSLKQSYDEVLLDEQQKILGKRNRRQIGKKMMWASIIPFAVSGTASIFTLYHIHQADKAKREIKNSAFANPENIQPSMDRFDDARDKAKITKATTLTSLAIGTSLLTIGFVLSF